MAILVDADVLIQAERGIFDLDAWLTSQPDEEFKMAAITVAELWHGAERTTGAHRTKRQAFLRRVFATFDFVPYTEQAALIYARLWADLESTGQKINAHDLMLAATALQTGSTLATFNKRNFAVIRGLEVIEPG